MQKQNIVTHQLGAQPDTSFHTDAIPVADTTSASILLWVSISGTTSDTQLYKTIRSIMVDYFKEHTDDSLEDRFEESLKAVNTAIEKFKNDGNNLGQMNAVLALLDDNLLHLTQTGGAELYLLRDGAFSIVSDGLSSDRSSNDTFANIASGNISQGDNIVFSSQNLMRYLSKNEFASTLHSEGIDKGLADVLHIAKVEKPSNLFTSGFTFVDASDNLLDLAEQQDKRAERKKNKSNDMLGKAQKMASDTLGSVMSMVSKARTRTPKSYQDKKKLLLLGVSTLVVILVFSAVVSSIQASSKKKEDFLAKKAQVNELISIAENKIIAKERDAARIKIREASVLLDEVKSSGMFADDVSVLGQKIAKEQDLLDGIVRFDKPELYAQLDSKNPKKLIFFDAFYVADAEGIYGPFEKNPKTITFKKLIDEVVMTADRFLEQGSIILSTESGKFYEYKQGAYIAQKSRDDSGFKKVDIVHTFGQRSSNVYALDRAANTIWKYPKSGSSYRFPQKYNKSGNVADVISFTIDGSIYGLKKDGTVIKFYRGVDQPFELRSSPSLALGSLPVEAKIFTSENLRNIYITDPDNNRILQYRKTSDGSGAIFSNQFVVPDSLNIIDIFVRDTETSLYILAGNQVYVLPI